MTSRLEYIVKDLLKELLGAEEVDTQHLKDTPRRVASTLKELTSPRNFSFTTFENHGINQMVVMQGIPFYTLCAHHLLPFYGKAHVAYIPEAKLVGLSKLPRTVKHFSRGLNIQEELTQDIANFLDEELAPKGVAVVMEGVHLCALMRGAEQDHMTTTSAMLGVFLDPDRGARQEFLSLIQSSRHM